MKKPLSFCMFLIFFVMISTAFASPKFEAVGETKYEFGTVNQGEKVKHDFELKNAGDEAMKILSVKGS